MSFRFLFPLIVSSTLLLSSCTFTKSGSTDFQNLYTNHIQAEISSLRDWAGELGYMESYQADGSLAAMVDIPAILSGAVSAGYSAKVHGQDIDLSVQNPSLRYETILASGSLLARQIDMMSQGGDVFFRYDGLSTFGLLDEAAMGVIDQYKNIWLALPTDAIDTSLSGSEDVATYKLSQALTRMTLSDVESYLTKYPLWKEEKNLGMSGVLMIYEVSLAKDNLLAMMGAFTLEATGNDLTSEQKTSLTQALADINVTGTIGFDPKDAHHMNAALTLIPSGGEALSISIDTSESALIASLSVSGSVSTWSYKKDESGSLFSLVTRQGGVEALRIDGSLKNTDGTKMLDMTASAPTQGLTLTLSHQARKGGDFEGKLNAGVGVLSWTGKIQDKTLAELHISGAMVGTTLSLNLLPSADGMIRGPLILKSGDTIALQADIGLRLTSEKIDLLLDIPSPDDASIKTHAEFHISGKRAPWSGKIDIPKDTKKFQEFADALQAVSPTPSFTQEFSGEDDINTPQN